MRPLLFATTSTEELGAICTRLREYHALTLAKRRRQKQRRLLLFACLILFGLAAASAGLRLHETFAPFPSDPSNQIVPEPMVIGRDYLEVLPGGRSVYAEFCGTVPSAAQLPHLRNNTVGWFYLAADSGNGWIWQTPAGSSEPAWIGPLTGPLSAMPAGALLVGHTYPMTLPDGRHGVARYLGTVATRAQLPLTLNRLGDMCLNIQSGICFVWTIPIAASSPQWIDP
jgi:hypothetical protein